MARVRRPQPTVESLFFATPEQKVLRFLLSEPTTTFTPRVISSRLKGVRGLGGVDGIMKILNQLNQLGMVDFVDNKRAVKLCENCPCVQTMKTFVSLCDLDTLKKALEPVSVRGILFGSRATGKFRSDSNYNLCVVSREPSEVARISEHHPLGKQIQLVTTTPTEYDSMERTKPGLATQVSRGIPLWGAENSGW
jgi:hypothetical protein